MNPFINTITSQNPEIRNIPFYKLCSDLSANELLKYFKELDEFRKKTPNLYEKVRASIFLYAGYRFFLMEKTGIETSGKISFAGYENLLNRNFEKAISIFQNELLKQGLNSNLFSAMAEGYHHITFQVLADQVRKSVRSSIGNQWMFRVGHPVEHPLKVRNELLHRNEGETLYPILHEKTPVRMDLTHSCWSDIFFLGMDYPEGARVINISVDLGVYNRDEEIKPPIESFVRVITEPVLRITSIDLKDTKDITELSELFNFGNDYLSLIKAAVIASGLISPSFEGTNYTIGEIFENIISPGMGIELVTKVNDIPKGSRLAVSTNLLASSISVLMRATGQTKFLEGGLNEQERRLIASRAILGEWLGGSGGGWQDSGGIWEGVKAIEGKLAQQNDPEFNISRGCLLPVHKVINDLPNEFEEKIMTSLILMHGGMASNVGPILEMVSEKYLLREEEEWYARQKANSIYDEIKNTIKTGDIKKLSELTSENFNSPIKTIIPWATTHFTEVIISRAKKMFGENYYGFLMLGGMSGGGMGMFVKPEIYTEAKKNLILLLTKTKKEMSDYLPFAMEPVIYNFNINKKGSFASLYRGHSAIMPTGYYSLQIPILSRRNTELLPDIRKTEIDLVTSLSKESDTAYTLLRGVIGSLFRFSSKAELSEMQHHNQMTEKIKKENGFDYVQHEQIRQDFQRGRIGLARNRLPAETIIEDVKSTDIISLKDNKDLGERGAYEISEGRVIVMGLAAGVGSRWTKGAGVIKAINPFVEFEGTHRSFLEIHLAKCNKTAEKYGKPVPFVVSTSYLTHYPIEKELKIKSNFGYSGDIYLSPGKSIGQRFIPMERDLHFLWEDMPQEQLDENKQKVREANRAALINWAKVKGEGSDYVDNIASQRLYPLGHWYEIPNMLRNGVMTKILSDHPDIQNIMLHNIDTLGANLDPSVLNFHMWSGNCLTFEVIPRRIEDRGGGLAYVNKKLRILEGLALPREEDELNLSYYNTMTTWININKLLTVFGLKREDIFERTNEEITEAVRAISRRIPTYVTIKDVKYRWGHGQEDILPTAQIEKLWGDMSMLPDVKCGYLAVPRNRGQQLKDPAQLNAWIKDGSRDYVSSLCTFGKVKELPGVLNNETI